MKTLSRAYLPLLLTVLAALTFVGAGAYASGDGKWHFLKAEEGIHVWKLEIPGKDLPGFRGQTVINASIEQIMKTMLDWKRHPSWMYRCKESLLLRRIDDSHGLMYNRTEAPWPVAERDVVLKSVITRSPDNTQLHLNFMNTETELKPPIDGVVRMPRLVGFYKMWALSPTQTKILYQVEADIGGSIPKWLATMAAQDLPYRTLSKLRERVMSTQR